MTITLELSPEHEEWLKRQLAAMPESEHGKFVVSLVERGYQLEKSRQEDERIASMRRGAAQLDAGDSVPLEESYARGRAELDRLITQRTELGVPSASEESLLSEEEKETS